MLSIVIPTYNERDNVKRLIPSIFSVLEKSGIKGEVIIVDDDSPDGTGRLADSLSEKYPVRVIHRPSKSGLSSAVIEGLKKARGDKLIVMDADFSHPPGKIPEMFQALNLHDLVVGSRYVKGGGIENWPTKRKITSQIAILLAKPLFKTSDPVSGFFGLKRKVLPDNLHARGYKIGLEIGVKGRYNSLTEIPYIFSNRKKGKSKLNNKEIFNYLIQLLALYYYKLRKIF